MKTWLKRALSGLDRGQQTVPILLSALLILPFFCVAAEESECNIPLVQGEFVRFMVDSREEHYRTNYANREYALNLETLVLNERASEAAWLIPNGDFNDWYAVIRMAVEIDVEGREVYQVSLEVGPYISLRLQFHNEIFGDSFDTRIPVESPLGQELSAILEGGEVIVSGQFVLNDDDFLETSLTPADAITYPAYLVELKEIRPVEAVTDCMDSLDLSSRYLPETPGEG